MSEKLLLQAPWAKFNRSVFWKKALDNTVNDGIRLILEHDKDWNRGISEENFEAVLCEFSNAILSSPLEKFKVFAERFIFHSY